MENINSSTESKDYLQPGGSSMKTFTMSALILGVALCVPVGANASDRAAPIHKHHAHHQVV